MRKLRAVLVPALLVGALLLVTFWIVMARQSARPFQPFDLTTADFEGFVPELPGGHVRLIPLSTHDPAEPNILMMEGAPPATRLGTRMAVRLVHGYNMPMCMKIKYYTVQCIGDYRTVSRQPVWGRQPFGYQVFRVTSGLGESAIWITTMIRAGDFSPSDVDIGSMAFPRVDVPDDPRWVPAGFSRSDFKQPITALRRWARARWNASRTDLLTFLRLRRPAWASEELLSFVTLSTQPAVTAANETAMCAELLGVHAHMLAALRSWRQSALRP